MRQSILAMEKYDIFELTEALYTFAILHNGGLWSDMYALQCDIGSYYSAGMGFSESKVEAENMFYHEITEDNAENIWNRVKYYLDNRWDDE